MELGDNRGVFSFLFGVLLGVLEDQLLKTFFPDDLQVVKFCTVLQKCVIESPLNLHDLLVKDIVGSHDVVEGGSYLEHWKEVLLFRHSLTCPR